MRHSTSQLIGLGLICIGWRCELEMSCQDTGFTLALVSSDSLLVSLKSKVHLVSSSLLYISFCLLKRPGSDLFGQLPYLRFYGLLLGKLGNLWRPNLAVQCLHSSVFLSFAHSVKLCSLPWVLQVFFHRYLTRGYETHSPSFILTGPCLKL